MAAAPGGLAGDLCFHFAFSAGEALTCLAQLDPTDLVLILSDINMPGMNGIELLQRIRSQYANTRMFLITGMGDAQSEESALASGADGLVTTPIDFDDLKARISQLQQK